MNFFQPQADTVAVLSLSARCVILYNCIQICCLIYALSSLATLTPPLNESVDVDQGRQ